MNAARPSGAFAPVHRHRERLLIIPSLRAVVLDRDRVVLTRKFLDGVIEFGRHWPGEIAALMVPQTAPTDNLDQVTVRYSELPFELDVQPIDDANVRDRLRGATGPAVVLGSSGHDQNHLSAICREAGVACVYVTEFSLATRLEAVRAAVRSPHRLVRQHVWQWKQEWRQRRAIRLADGLQCNGTPSYEAYRKINARPLLYFDSRIRRDMLPADDEFEDRLREMRSGRRLRLAFSGRFVEIKGVDHLPPFAHELRRLNVPFELDIFGGGSLEKRLRFDIARKNLHGHVRMHDAVDFAAELVPRLRNAVDLFICPHRQSDPSCTYLETMSCGVPIAGYANDAWMGILREADVGWSAPMNRPRALARLVARLHLEREEVARASRAALAFARHHTLERTMPRRVEHLLLCAGSLPLSQGEERRTAPPERSTLIASVEATRGGH